MRILKRVLLIVLVIAVAIALYMIYWVNDFYKADDKARNLLETSDNIVVSEDYLKITNNSENALIFYPGAKVEYISYLPLLYNLSKEADIDVFIVEMPFNLAFLGSDRADEIINTYDYENWYMAGHSLGGAMASVYADENQDKVSKLILLGSYVYSDFPLENSLTIYGSLEDGLNELEYDKNLKIVEGGSHASFGNYGEQKNYISSNITREEQQKITIDYILDFLKY